MGCIYRNGGDCTYTNLRCPWVMWCAKVQGWKERAGMEKYCKYKTEKKIPDGYYKVEFEKKGYLYILFENHTLKILNPYDYVPDFVKLYKNRGNWKIKKEKESDKE